MDTLTDLIQIFRDNLKPEPIEQPLSDYSHNSKLSNEFGDFLEEPIDGSESSEIFKLYRKHKSVFWTETEIDMTEDKAHYKLLSQNEKFFLTNILGFFAGSDVIVNENIDKNYSTKITQPHILMYYKFQAMMEDTHSLTYSNMLRALLERDEYEKIKRAVINMPIVKKKADWARKWINKDCSLVELLIAFKCVEGIFFSGSFCAIYWLGELRKNEIENLFPGIRHANEFIARDEGIHVEAADLIYKKYIVNQLPFEIVKSIFMEAVEIEKEFITKSLPCNLIGMNAELMCEYIEYVANHELKNLGFDERLFPSRGCPFQFMIKINLSKKTNFFEFDDTNYNKAGVFNKSDKDNQILNDEGF